MEKSAFGTFVYCRKRITSRGSSPWCPETHRQNSGDEMRLLMTVSLHGNGSEESGAMRGIGVSVVGCASRRIHSRILATTFRTPRGRWKRRHHSKAGPRPDRNERRGRILEVFDRGARPRARSGAATATGEFQSVVLGAAGDVVDFEFLEANIGSRFAHRSDCEPNFRDQRGGKVKHVAETIIVKSADRDRGSIA